MRARFLSCLALVAALAAGSAVPVAQAGSEVLSAGVSADKLQHASSQATPPAKTTPNSGSVAGKRQLTLEDCLDLALRKNADILRAKSEIERSKGVTIETRAAALPRLSLESQLGTTDEYLVSARTTSGRPPAEKSSSSSASSATGNTTTTAQTRVVPNTDKATNEQWDISVKVTKTIFDAGGTRASIAMAKLDEESAFLDLQETVQEVLLQVKLTFNQVLLNRSLITVQEQSVKLLAEELENQRRRFEAGTVTRFNVLRAEVALSNQKPELIRAKNNYRLAMQDLARLIAEDLGPGIAATDLPFEITGLLSGDRQELDLQKGIADATGTRPLIKRLDNTVARERKSKTRALSGYYPTVSAYATYGYEHEGYSEDWGKTDGGYTAGVQGSWNIFDGLETKGQVDQAHARIMSAMTHLEDEKRKAEIDVRQAYSSYLEALELMESQAKTVEQAEESLRLAQSRFDAGAGTQIEVLDAQVALTTARSTELQSRHDYQKALAEFHRASGGDFVFKRIADTPKAQPAQIPSQPDSPATKSQSPQAPTKQE